MFYFDVFAESLSESQHASKQSQNEATQLRSKFPLMLLKRNHIIHYYHKTAHRILLCMVRI